VIFIVISVLIWTSITFNLSGRSRTTQLYRNKYYRITGSGDPKEVTAESRARAVMNTQTISSRPE
jgi:hypothetical protein